MFPRWYRFQITSGLSILHRLTGIALTVGSIADVEGLRRPLRVPARFGERPGPSLEAREERVREVAGR